MSGIDSSGLSRATVQTMIDASAGGALAPGVVPDLLTIGMPLLGSWWGNAPVLGGTSMGQITSNGFAFTAFGGGPGASADPIGLQFDSAAGSWQGCGWYNLATPETTLSRRPWIRGRVKTSATITDQSVFVGWTASGSPFGGGAVLTNNTIVMMVDNTGGGGYSDTTWQIRAKATGAVTTVDTAVPYTASHDYEVYLTSDGVNATWAIYDRTTSTAYGGTSALATAPATTTNLGCVYHGISGAGSVAVRFKFGPCVRGQFGPA